MTNSKEDMLSKDTIREDMREKSYKFDIKTDEVGKMVADYGVRSFHSFFCLLE
jgi:hypothetical protein